MDSVSNNKRIAKNTIFLYFRMMIIMLVTLFTSRIILQSLGVEDYGLYNLVGGVTAMFTFLNGALSDATQRYLTFELGRGKDGKANNIFSLCMILHVIMAAIIVVITETVGLWFLYNKLQIPEERINAAFWVFQFSVASLFILFVSVPYYALIIAYERMKAFAFFSIFTSGINLLIAYALFISGSLDRLILYAFLLFILQVITNLIYIVYCRRSFSESKFRFVWDNKKIRELTGFVSWTLIGNISYIAYTQGLNILLGMFFLPVVNAARGIAVQVQNAVNNFVKNFQTAINPQITKSYAAGNLAEMHSLIFRSSRFSFFLLMVPMIPIIYEAPLILKLWLTEVPENTIVFLRIIILTTWVNSLANPLGVSSKATGNIKLYEGTVATLKLFIVPIAYVCLKIGLPAVSVFIVHLIVECCTYSANLLISHHLVHLPLRKYFKEVTIRIIVVGALSFISPIIICLFMSDSILRLITLGLTSCIVSVILIICFGLTMSERSFLFNKAKLIINKNISI